MTPAGTSNELDVQNEWEENTVPGMGMYNRHVGESHQVYVCIIALLWFYLSLDFIGNLDDGFSDYRLPPVVGKCGWEAER